MPEIREEQIKLRDLGLSRRHKKWGLDCPVLDIDFLMMDYDKGEALALIEYRNEHEPMQYASHPTYQAIADLGTKAGIPVIACRYNDDYSRYIATPLNYFARNYISERKEFSEAEWVSLLYEIKGHKISKELLESMNISL